MFDKLKSRKFWFALCGALMPVGAQFMSASVDAESALQMSVGVVVAYLFGQGYVDGKTAEAAGK